MNYWLLKTEPESFSIDDLKCAKNQTTFWDGVRNYQARNYMRDMKVGDRAIFYHSNAAPPAAVGTAVICREAYPDFTQFDPHDKHYDAKASQGNPIWDMVDIRWESTFAAPLPLETLRQCEALEGLELLRQGSRLSVMPMTKAHFETILKLAAEPPTVSSETKKRNASPTAGKKVKKRTAKKAATKKRPAPKAAKKSSSARKSKKATQKRG